MNQRAKGDTVKKKLKVDFMKKKSKSLGKGDFRTTANRRWRPRTHSHSRRLGEQKESVDSQVTCQSRSFNGVSTRR
jgi:hypothetical protein